MDVSITYTKINKSLVAKLQALLTGARNPALAADPELASMDAAELQLLLEALSSH